MRILVDENMAGRRLSQLLEAAGHDVILAFDAGLLSATDPRVMIWAIGQSRAVLTRDYEDFEDLHDLISSAGGSHHGILAIRFDGDPRRSLSDRGITTAIAKLAASGVPVAGMFHILNQWR
jgi:predicted nuclease of predicted toxin-antitoxin system